MRSTDIHALAWVSDPQLSPDGTHVAYVVNRIDEAANRYTSRIWLASTDGTAPPRPLTSGEHKDSQPRWSPDGHAIAFVSTRKKDGKGRTRSTLHLLPVDGPGETVALADHDESMSDLAWSPDGSLIAVTARVRSDLYDIDEIDRRPPRRITSLGATLNGEGFVYDRPRHVHLIAADGSCPMQDITPGDWECASPAWMPDGTTIAVEVNRFGNDYADDIGLVDIGAVGGEDPAPPRLLTHGDGRYIAPAPVADGSALVVLGADDLRTYPQNSHIGLLSTDGPGTPDWRSRSVDRTWEPVMAGSSPTLIDDDTVLAGIEERGDVHLMRLSLSTGEAERLVSGELTVTGWSHATTEGGEVIAYTATSATRPAELLVLSDGTTRQLTNHTDAFVRRAEPQQPEHFLAPSGDVEVDAWIVRPHDFDPTATYPMLLNIHGGPHTQYGNFYFDEVQMQAREGFVVVYSNPRGGSGREQAWGQSILGPKHPVVAGSGWGSVDYDDLMAVVDTALDRYDFIDPDRLGVLGGSYGGYMTTWIVSHTDRFKAACSERAANNLLSLEYGSDLGGFFAVEMGPPFYEDADEYLRMSPISYLDAVDTPLLIIHSDDDLRCPAEQAFQLFTALTLMGKDVEFYLFSGEDHELSRSGSPIHRVQRADLIHEYFRRHLDA